MSLKDRIRKGGGYLNEVDVTWVGGTWFTGEGVEIKKGNRKGETFTPLSFVPEFLVDGEDEPKTQRLLLGDAEGYGEVTDDDQVLQTPDGQGIGAKSELGIFLASLVEAKEEVDALIPDDPSCIDFRPLYGMRLRLVQEVNADKTKRQGKQKGKDGKEYDRKDLKVATVHSLPEEAPAKPAAKAAGKPAAAASKPAGKPAAAAKKVNIGELAESTLKGILQANDGKILKTKLSMAILKALNNDPSRDAVREFLFDDENLGGIDGVTYNAKKGTITLD